MQSMEPIQIQELLKTLGNLADLESGQRDLGGVLNRIPQLVKETLNVSHAYCAVALETSSLVASSGTKDTFVRSDSWEGPGVLAREAIEHKQTQLWQESDIGDGPSPSDRLDAENIKSWVCVPLSLTHPRQGVLVAACENGPIDETSIQLLEQVAAYLEVILRNLFDYQRNEALALTDELTRLYNFRFLKAALRREMERASRYGQMFSIIMIDVDHLKAYNDQHGHLKGSELLRQLAGILSRSSRAIDLVAKYGGDEFLVILPQTRLEGAVSMANRIREAVAQTAFPHCEAGHMTVSIGVAAYPQHGETVQSLVSAADEALFAAKRANRNCVIPAEKPGNDGLIMDAA